MSIVWLLLLLTSNLAGIIPHEDPLGIHIRGPLTQWVDPGGPLDERLIHSWPEKYLERHHPFNPWTFLDNAKVLCAHKDLARALIDRMLEYTEVDGEKRFVVTRFDYDFEGNLLRGPWRSAFNNGVVMTGLVSLSRCGHDDALGIASELARGMDDLATDLPDGTRWYEEYITDTDPQPHILNGHIYALLGLYYLWNETGDLAVLSQLQSGIDAAANHTLEYRRPGQTNLYDLKAPATPDYGPARAIYQQDMLCLITGRQVFAYHRDLFAEDMPDHAATLTFQCSTSA